jgi:mycothione reductase
VVSKEEFGMKEYDVIVIGSGSGSSIVDQALGNDMKVALVDKGPVGGTCLNVGCIPSKMLIFPADRIVEIEEAKKLGIEAEIKRVDFEAIMERTRKYVSHEQAQIRESIRSVPGLDFYETTGRFVDDYTMEVKGEKIKGKKIYIASGARPLIPPVKGIETIDYLTNENVFALRNKPESLLVIGGGFIAAEFSHFFSAVGTKVTVLERQNRLVKEEEPEISELLKKKMEQRMEIHTGTEAVEAEKIEEGCRMIAREKESGKRREFVAEKVLIASGRMSNADLLDPEKTGVRTNEKNYIVVDDFLQTTKKNIWAFGDAIGKKMFRHAANREADLVWHNSMHGGEEKIDFLTIPHAVFTYPPIASVGMGEAEAKKLHEILVGKSVYSEVARGVAMREEECFAKAVIEKKTGRILGFHIIGPYASILIQEVIDAMATEGTVMPLINGMHIHPALPEVIVDTLRTLREPE